VILRWLDDLGQNAAGVFGVGESNSRAADTDPRLLVDQFDSCGAKPLKFTLNVTDLIGDVMHPWAAALNEATDGGVGAERLEQFDVILPNIEQHGLYALLLDDFAVHKLHPQRALIQL